MTGGLFVYLKSLTAKVLALNFHPAHIRLLKRASRKEASQCQDPNPPH